MRKSPAILSDDTIVERLREAGIEIARRTVAKYREAMRIPSSVQRRRDKQSMLGNAHDAAAIPTGPDAPAPFTLLAFPPAPVPTGVDAPILGQSETLCVGLIHTVDRGIK